MKVTVDTNVLIRAVVRDDVKQALAADKILKEAELIAVAIPSLCEFVWVLSKLYGLSRQDIAAAIRALISAKSVVVDRQAVEAGLAIMEAGGDFADGVIAHEGNWLGADMMVTFDKKAAALLKAQSVSAQLIL